MSTSKIFTFGGMTVSFCLDDTDTNGQVTMFEVTVKPDARMPVPHYHEAFDECAYMLQGECTFTIDGQVKTYSQGECCYIPRGVVHGFENRSVEECRFLSVITPGIFNSSYFSDLTAVIRPDGPPDIAKIKEVMLQHGLVPMMS